MGIARSRMARAAALPVALLVVACGSGGGLSGRYTTENWMGDTEGYEFRDGQNVDRLTATGHIWRMTYTRAGDDVTVCIGGVCQVLRLDGACLVDGDVRYCREP